MSDTAAVVTPLRAARESKGFSREHAVRLLQPPISSKTLERWEDPDHPSAAPGWRLDQLAALYGVAAKSLNGKVT